MPAKTRTQVSSLKAGSAKIKINPDIALPLVGFPGGRLSTGIGKDLYVRVIVFSETKKDIPATAIVVLDNLYVDKELTNSIRTEIIKQLPNLTSQSIMLVATHTHSAPSLRRYKYKGSDKGVMDPDLTYLTKVKKTCVKAAIKAWESREIVSFEVGLTEAFLGSNRRVVSRKGNAENVWRDPKGEQTGYFDPRVRFLKLAKTDNSIMTVLSGYGCHPVALGPLSRKISADYPGYFATKLEKILKAKTAIHVTKGGADVNPRNCLKPNPTAAKTTGEELARIVADAIDYTYPVNLDIIKTASVNLKLKVGKKVADFWDERVKETKKGGYITTEVQAIRIGDMVIVSAPGELFSDLASKIENLSKFRHTLVVGYANDCLGYLFSDEAWRQGGYEATNQVSAEIEKPLLGAVQKVLQKVAK